MRLPRLILADDHTLVVEALRQLLLPHFDIVATAADGLALIDLAVSHKPDVVVIDIGMPLLNGLEAGRQIKTRMSNIKIVFFDDER